MIGFQLTLAVNAKAERAFAVFTDIKSAKQHVKAITSIEMLTEGPIGEGTRWSETRCMYGRQETMDLEIGAYRPSGHYTVIAEAHGARYETRFDFVPEGDAALVHLSFQAYPRSFFAKLMSPLARMMMGSMKKSMKKDLDDLKIAVEST